MRGLLAAPATLKVPVFFHSGGATTVPGPAIPASVRLELVDFLLHPPIASPPAFEINGRAYLAPPVPTVTSTVGADVPTITIDLRHVLALMIHSDGVPQPVFRALLELCKANPDLLEDSARQLEQIRTQLPPVRFLPTDPTLQTLAPRLTEAIAALRSVTAGLAIDRSQQEKLTAFLALADHPLLR